MINLFTYSDQFISWGCLSFYEQERNQDLSANWFTGIRMIKFAGQVDDCVLAFSALECIGKWMIKRKKAETRYYLSPSFHVVEQVLVDVIHIARRSYSTELLDGAWLMLKESRGKREGV